MTEIKVTAINEKVLCPVCQSADVITSIETSFIKNPYSNKEIRYSTIKHECKTCHESGDFLHINDEAFRTAEKQSKDEEINAILSFLSEKGYTAAYIERVLGLPQRTLARWKTGGYSHSATPLLRFIRTYPWLLNGSKNI